MQRIEVKNFGPLKDVSLDIKDYMIFIGPQASGKSTLAKLVYSFLGFKSDLFFWYFNFSNSINAKYSSSNFILKELWDTIFEAFKILGSDYEVKFIFQNGSWVKFSNNIFQVSDNLSDFLENIYSFYQKEYPKWSNLKISTDDRRLQRELFSIAAREKFDGFFGKSQTEDFFIPAGRSTFSIVPNARVYQFNDSLYLGFSNFIGDISEKILLEKQYNIENPKVDSLYSQLTLNILKGKPEFKLKKNELKNDEIIPELLTSYGFLELKNTSSGQQETFWIIVIIKYLLYIQRSTFLVIEEPEAHLFPEAQRDLTYLISLLANQQGNQVLLTTHSPYILASLNNLLKAYTVGQSEQNKEAVGKIIDPLLWVNPERVYVGYMENGEIRPILNPDLQQIEHDLLDNVSNDIMTKFDELLDIQYNQ